MTSRHHRQSRELMKPMQFHRNHRIRRCRKVKHSDPRNRYLALRQRVAKADTVTLPTLRRQRVQMSMRRRVSEMGSLFGCGS